MSHTPSVMPPAAPPLSPAELGVLRACREVTLRAAELLPLLSESVGIPVNELFSTWRRRCKQHGDVRGTDWRYFFHGYECDLSNKGDGRFLRVDFGPRGSTDTFTAWGVLQLIMTAVPPWAEFPELRVRFADRGPPFDAFSGSLAKIGEVWDRLEARGAFEPADPTLIELEARHTTVGPDGIHRIVHPPDTSDEMALDCAVAHRPRLSARGHELLDAHLGARAG